MKSKKGIYFTIIIIIFVCILLYFAGGFSIFNNDEAINVNQLNGKITVFSPAEGEVISSPYRIMGQARGNWYFEGSFPIKLLDDNGNIIAITIGTAISDWMTEDFVSFMAEIKFDKPSTNSGVLIFKKDNPSGLPENDDEIKISVGF